MTISDASVILVGLATGYVLVSWLSSRRHDSGRSGADSSPQHERKEPPHPKRDDPVRARAPWYEVLRVPANASLEEIKLAYRRRIAEYHPDKTSGLGDELRALAEEKSKIINAAYDEAMHAAGK